MAETNILRETSAYLKAEKRFEWKVGNFKNLTCKDVVKSDYFNFHHAEWHLQLYPYGKPEYNCGSIINIMLSLKKEISIEECHVRYRMSMKMADDTEVEKSKELTFKKEEGGNSIEFIERSKVMNPENDLLDQDGILTIYFSISTVGDLSEVGPSDDLATLFEDLQNLHREGLHADVKIKVGNTEFPAHKCILAARSSVFASMFRHETEENISGTVKITDCDPDTFKQFLFFLYTGKLNDLSSDDAASLYKIADKYDLNGLKKECARCMVREMSSDSVRSVLNLATYYNDSDLLMIATNFYSRNVKPAIVSGHKINYSDRKTTK